MEEDKQEQFQRLWSVLGNERPNIIAIMGAPSTMKTQLARHLGRWARCPVLCIQHFFSTCASTSVKEDNAMKKKNKNEEVVHHAFSGLCKVAEFHLSNELSDCYDPLLNSTVIMKSRFNSMFEFQSFLDLAIVGKVWILYPAIIIECRFTNEYQWKEHFEKVTGPWIREESEYSCWCRPQSWEEMETKKGEWGNYYQSVWELHLNQLITSRDDLMIVRRLVVDPIDDFFSLRNSRDRLPIDFDDAIKYLRNTSEEDLFITHTSQLKNPYTVGLHELRPLLFENRLIARLAAKGRTLDMYCSGGECVFQYSEHLIIDHGDICCGVCGKQVASGTPAYACRLCILTLHKSCAERVDFKALRLNLELILVWVEYYHKLMPERHACKSCLQGGKGFDGACNSCNFETHLKCGLLPTIMHHNSHSSHFLSLLVISQDYRCKACGIHTRDFSYCCKPCNVYYHMECAFTPLELLKHKHGGHEHVMKLLYSHHDTDEDGEPEESYWCDVCGQDMDPQNWCYSCKDCPYYSTHLWCARHYAYLYSNVRNAKFVPQIQAQLEAAMAEDNVDSKTHDGE